MLWAKETWMHTFATVGVAILLFLSYDHINFPAEPFASRRFLPQAIPVLIVALAGASVWFRLNARLLKWGGAFVGLLVLYAVAHGIYVNAKMNSRSDADGLLDRVQAISETVGPKGIVVLRQSSPLAEIAPLLAFGFQRNVFPLQIRSNRDMQAIGRYLADQELSGHTIWLWTNSVDDRMGFSARTSGAAILQEITVPFLHMTTTDRPFSWDKRTWKFSLSKISFTDGGSAAAIPHAKQP